MDWNNFNALSNCNASNTGIFNGGGGGNSGQQDWHYTTGNYICLGTMGMGAGLGAHWSGNNEKVVQGVYSGIFGSGDTEIFAEGLPVQLGYRNDGSGTTVWDWTTSWTPA